MDQLPPSTLPKVFDPIRWKIARAKHHSKIADKLAKDFLKTDFYTITPQLGRNDRLVFRITECDPLPYSYGIIIGEAAHQIRSTLDHLIVMLAKPRTPREERQICFPIVEHRKDFNSVLYKMRGVPRGVRTVVESLQPYHRRKLPETLSIWQITEIDNWDKHRTVLTSSASSELSEMAIGNPQGIVFKKETFTGIFKSGAVVSRLEIPKGQGYIKMTMQPHFTLIPVFDDRMPKILRRIPCLKPIYDAGTFIENTVLPMFERFF